MPKKRILAFAVALALGGALDASAQTVSSTALPTGGNVVAGEATIGSAGSAMTIQQSSTRAAIDWQSFNIGSQASVTFQQPSASAIALNRVLGTSGSAIYGRLSANGQVFLINPNGVLFGRGAQVDVGALLASPIDMSPADFMSGRYVLDGGGTGSVVNRGAIRTAPGGYAALIAPSVLNEGTIESPGGAVTLAAASGATLDFMADGLVRIRIDRGALAAEVANHGVITADGGAVLLKAESLDALAPSVVNNSGIIEATGIRVEGDYVALTGSARLDASGVSGGGEILVGGNAHGEGPEKNAARTYVGSDVVLDASATGAGDGGKVIVWSNDETRFYGTIRARGGELAGDGGFVETSGGVLQVTGSVDTSAPNGATGTWLLDPKFINIVLSGADFVPTQNVFSASPSGTSSITAASLNGALSEVILQANTDITFDTAVNIRMQGVGITAQAGRSVIVKADITTTGGNVSLTGNDPGALQSDRDAGTGGVFMDPGTTIDAGAGAVALNAHSDSKGLAGDIVAANISAPSISLDATGKVTLTGAFVADSPGSAASVFVNAGTLVGVGATIDVKAISGGSGVGEGNVDIVGGAGGIDWQGGHISATSGVDATGDDANIILSSAGTMRIADTAFTVSGFNPDIELSASGALAVSNSTLKGVARRETSTIFLNSLNGAIDVTGSTLSVDGNGPGTIRNDADDSNITFVAKTDINVTGTTVAANGGTGVAEVTMLAGEETILGDGITSFNFVGGGSVNLNAGSSVVSTSGPGGSPSGAIGSVSLSGDDVVVASGVPISVSSIDDGQILVDAAKLAKLGGNFSLQSTAGTATIDIAGPVTGKAGGVQLASGGSLSADGLDGALVSIESGSTAILGGAIAATVRDSGALAEVRIDATGDIVSGNTTIRADSLALATNGVFRIQGGTTTLAVAQPLAVLSLDIAGGTLSGTGGLTVTKSYTQTGGALSMTGAVSIAHAAGPLALGTMTVGSLSATAFGGDITLSGLLDAGTGAVTLDASGAVDESGSGGVATTGVLTVASNGGQTLGGGNRLGGFSAIAGDDIVLANSSAALALGPISTPGTLAVTTSGSISGAGPVTASDITLNSVNGVAALTTQTSGLAVSNVNNTVDIRNTGVLALKRVTNTNGDFLLDNIGDVTVLSPEQVGGVFRIGAHSSIDVQQSITANTTGTVSGTAIALSSDADVTQAAGATLDAGTAALAIDAPGTITFGAVNATAIFINGVCVSGCSAPVQVSAPPSLDPLATVLASTNETSGNGDSLGDPGVGFSLALGGGDSPVQTAALDTSGAAGLGLPPNMADILAELNKLRAQKDRALAKAVEILERDPGIADLKPCTGEVSDQCIAPAPEHPGNRGAQAAPKLAYLPAIERKVALLIGEGDYRGAIPKLASPAKDVEEIGRLYGEQFGYEVRTLRNASKRQIVHELNRLIKETGPGDSVAIFYAGHGQIIDKTGRGYWIPSTASADDPRQWLSNADIARFLQNIPAKQLLLVSDSCYSGTLAGEARVEGVAGDPAAVLARRSVTVLSSGGSEPVADSGKDGHSVFAWHFLDRLKDVKEWSNGASLYEGLAQAVQRDFPQEPQYGAALDSGHQAGGDFLFEVRRY